MQSPTLICVWTPCAYFSSASECMAMKLCWDIDCLPYSCEQDSTFCFIVSMEQKKCPQYIPVRHNIMTACFGPPFAVKTTIEG